MSSAILPHRRTRTTESGHRTPFAATMLLMMGGLAVPAGAIHADDIADAAVDEVAAVQQPADGTGASEPASRGLRGLIRRLGSLDTAVLDEVVEYGTVRDVVVGGDAEAAATPAGENAGRILALAVVRREPRNHDELLTYLVTGTAVPDPTLGRSGDRRIAAADDVAAETGAATALEVSLDAAWIAANRLAAVDIDFDRYVAVTGATADSVLEAGDRVLLLDGEPVGRGRFVAAAGGTQPESVFTVIRGEHRIDVSASAVDLDDVSVLEAARTGTVRPAMVVRTVTSGPSAGIVSSLAYLDAITAGDLTGGMTVAGTGTITPHGYVGAVEGVAAKAVAAVEAGADVLFVHGDNRRAAEEAVAGGLTVVAVSSLRDAVEWLDAHRGDRLAPSTTQVEVGPSIDVGDLIEPPIASL